MTFTQAIRSVVCLALATGGPLWAKKFTFDSTPVKQGRIFVNEQFVGIAPITVEVKLTGAPMKARAEKEGSLGLWTTEFTKDSTTVMVRLEEDDAAKQTIASDIANKWLTIDPAVSGGAPKVIDENEAWKKIVSIVTDNFSDIEQLDRASFYLRTAWRVRRFSYSAIRDRIIIKRGITPNLTIRIEVESQIFRSLEPLAASLPLRDESFTENPRVFPADQETIKNLRDQF